MAVTKTEGVVANDGATIQNVKNPEESIVIVKGRTRLRANHWAVKQSPSLFDPLETSFDYEKATAAPGEARGDS